MLTKTFRIPEGDNPMKKATLIVTGSDAEVHIDVLLEDYGMEDDGNLTGEDGDRLLRPYQVDRKKLIHMSTLLVSLRRYGSDLRSEFARTHKRHEQLLTVLNTNITHMMRNPVNIIQRQKDL